MKKMYFIAGVCACAILAAGCSKKSSGNAAAGKTVKIGIAKIVQHVALDDIERGVIDAINDAGFNATYDLQNANGDVNTANQIASQFKDENVGEKNVTGMSDELPSVEHIKLFKKLAGIKTLGYIYTSSEDNSISGLALVKKGCAEAGLELVTQSISATSEVKQAAEAIVDRVDGIYLTTDNTVFSALPALVGVFNKAKKPIFSGDVTGAKEGGCFMASGFNYYKAGRATGEMVVQILNGAKPSEMPIRFMTKPSDSDLLFDLEAAAISGITIPEEYLSQATYIIQNGKLEEK